MTKRPYPPPPRISTEDMEKGLAPFDEAIQKAQDYAAAHPESEWVLSIESDPLDPTRAAVKLTKVKPKGEGDV